MIVQLFREVREPDFLEASEYILKKLRSEHSTEIGVRALPKEALGHVLRVCGLYEDVGKLVSFGVIDEFIAIGSIGISIERAWEATAPYILKERELASSQHWIFFENLAYRCTVNSPRNVRSKLGLKQFPEGTSTPRHVS